MTVVTVRPIRVPVACALENEVMVWPPLGKRARLIATTPPAPEGGLAICQAPIEKLARAGEQAGFRVEEMIAMLKAGVSIGALLDMISYSLSHEALDFAQQRQGKSISASAPLRIALEGSPWDA